MGQARRGAYGGKDSHAEPQIISELLSLKRHNDRLLEKINSTQG